MCVATPHRVVLLLITLGAICVLSGCPGSLEDPERFGEPDAASGGGGSGGGSSAGGASSDAGSDL
ncbi:MAG: hypothetical protein IPI67_10405 [Myxococcales bacterium]|nr:hypothetical protein [Myxococcales bacterium]